MNLKKLHDLFLKGKLEKHSYISAMHEKHVLLFDYSEYIGDTDIESIFIEKDKIVVTIKETKIKMFLDKSDSRFIPIEILNFHSFDPVEKDLIFFLANQSQIIFDIGANIGWYSLNFNNLKNVEKVYSFEPIPRTYKYLTSHIDLNEAKKISPHNLALYNKKGEIEFFWTKKETGSSSMKNIQERKNINKVKCKTDTLDNFVKENKTRVDMIKCDVEGSELFVFKGSQEVLQKDKPFIFTEMLRKWSTKFDYHPNDIIKLLTGIGYRCFAYEENRLIEFIEINSDTKPTNYFFLHEEKHRDVIKTVC